MGYTINDTDSRYNGWTNYATWRVYLEAFDGLNIADDFDGNIPSAYDVAQWAKDYAHDVVYNSINDTGGGIAEGWALAFLSGVDWASIARHLIENATEVA
jgi:hypothetical protein